jgi:hypothetical protein
VSTLDHASLRPRNDDARCPLCGAAVSVGSSANWCPRFHYNVEHEFDGHADIVVSERFTLGGCAITVDHGDSVHMRKGIVVEQCSGTGGALTNPLRTAYPVVNSDTWDEALAKFPATFRCPFCPARAIAVEDIESVARTLATYECPCGMRITFLHNFEKVEWWARGQKSVAIEGRSWLLTYDWIEDVTMYACGVETHARPGFYPPDRFANLLVFT